MAAGDLRVVSDGAGVRQFDTASGTTAINPGEPVGVAASYTTGTSDTNVVRVLTDGEPLIGTDVFHGIAASAGTHTSSADGKVNVMTLIPNSTRIRGKAATSTNIDTASELEGVLFDYVTFDVSGSTYTIDEDDAAAAAGLEIVDGDTAKTTLDVEVDARAMRLSVS